MRDISLIILLGLLITAVVDGLMVRKERDALRTEAASAVVAADERDAEIQRITDDFKKLHDDIDARPPVVVTERVYVKASCVQVDTASGLGDGTQPGRVELDRRSVESVVEVTDKWQRDFERCSVKLEAIQKAVRE